MPKLSVCIEMCWRELPYEERVARVARSGIPRFRVLGLEEQGYREAQKSHERTPSSSGSDVYRAQLQPEQANRTRQTW